MSHEINETLFSPKHPSILFFDEKKKTIKKKTIADIGKTAATLACNFSPSGVQPSEGVETLGIIVWSLSASIPSYIFFTK